MKGVFVSNGYLRGSKFSEPFGMMSAAASSLGIGLTEVRNSELAFPIGGDPGDAVGDADFVIFWDKDVRCASNLEACGFRLFNCSECVRVCDDKALTHIALSRWSIPSPETVVCPLSFSDYDDTSFLDRAAGELGFPMVVKDCFGSFGEQVHLAEDMDTLRRMFEGPYVPRILQRYVECGGRDIRIEVVGGRAVAAMERRAGPGEFRANATLGGSMSPHRPSVTEEDLAVAAAEAVGADFCGVDILVGEDGPMVCEVNSNAHIRNLLDCTGIDVSRDILRHIAGAVGR